MLARTARRAAPVRPRTHTPKPRTSCQRSITVSRRVVANRNVPFNQRRSYARGLTEGGLHGLAQQDQERDSTEALTDDAVSSTEGEAALKLSKRFRLSEEEFFNTANFLNEALLRRNAYANDPTFSPRAEAKAYQLHKSNPGFWNADRLANLFKVSLARMRVVLWLNELYAKAKEDGFTISDTIPQLLGQKFGESYFPDEISDIPDRIPFKNKHNGFFYIDGDIRSGELMKQLRSKHMVYYKESPRYARQPVPQVKEIIEQVPSGCTRKIYPRKHDRPLYIFDLSKYYDLYTRPIIVRELDGSLRTANWQERRYIEDTRRYLKFPTINPFPRPDESQPDHVPPHARVPDEYQEDLSYVERGEYMDAALREYNDAKTRKFWDRISVRYD